jgi:hypothetical protein
VPVPPAHTSPPRGPSFPQEPGPFFVNQLGRLKLDRLKRWAGSTRRLSGGGSYLLGLPLPSNGPGIEPLAPGPFLDFDVLNCDWRRALRHPNRPPAGRPYFGGCNSRELAQSFKCEAVSACRAFRRSRSRSGPGRTWSACARIVFDQAESRSCRESWRLERCCLIIA